MVFVFWAGLVAGLAGAIAMTAMMKMASSAGMTSMPPMTLIQGAMMTDDEATAKRIGMFTHIVMMGTLVFGTLYAALFSALGTADWWVGALIGVVHGVVAGMLMAMMGARHPRMEPAGAFKGGDTVRSDAGQLRIAAPGAFGKNYGGKTPMGLIVGHVVYGVVVALVYSALV